MALHCRHYARTLSIGFVILSVSILNCCEGFQQIIAVVPIAENAWSWYKSMLLAKPLLTKSLTSSCIMSISDIMCQGLVKRQSTVNMAKTEKGSTQGGLDYIRTVQVSITGFVWSGPITHLWYSILERIYNYIAQMFQIQNPGVALAIKLCLDSILFSPVVITGYFTVRSFLEGTGLAGAKEKVTTKFKSTLLGAWKFWPLANAINFYYVPLQFRVLYMNILSLFWSGYLTFVNSQKVSHGKQATPIPKAI